MALSAIMEAHVVQPWGLATGATWLSTLLLIAIIAILGAAISIDTLAARRDQRRGLVETNPQQFISLVSQRFTGNLVPRAHG